MDLVIGNYMLNLVPDKAKAQEIVHVFEAGRADCGFGHRPGEAAAGGAQE